jgi:hypothetical protein
MTISRKKEPGMVAGTSIGCNYWSRRTVRAPRASAGHQLNPHSCNGGIAGWHHREQSAQMVTGFADRDLR